MVGKKMKTAVARRRRSRVWGFEPRARENFLVRSTKGMQRCDSYIVNVHSLAINSDRDFITLALFRIGETVDIADTSFTRGGMEGSRQLCQNRRRLQVHGDRDHSHNDDHDLSLTKP